MTTTTFDTLSCFEKLKAAGVPEAQAWVQVEVMQGVVQRYNEASRKELATKGDVQNVRNELANTKYENLKWMMLIVAIIAFLK